jgi:hypothetical protein
MRRRSLALCHSLSSTATHRVHHCRSLATGSQSKSVDRTGTTAPAKRGEVAVEEEEAEEEEEEEY